MTDIACLFIRSFVQTISIAPIQVHLYSEALPTQHGYCVGVYTLKRYGQLQVKDLPKVPTWRLERESNPRPSDLKSSSQPRRHHVPHCCCCQFNHAATT